VSEPISLDTFIYQYQLEDVSICRNIIETSEKSSRWNNSLTVAGSHPFMRESESLQFSAEMPPSDHEKMLMFMQECVTHYTQEIPAAGDVVPFGLREGYTILKYKPDEAYHAFHSDQSYPDLINRHITLILYLNTIDEGGETEFKYQKLKVPPVAGRAIIFPAFWGYTHRSLPAVNQTRYVLNAFYGFLEGEINA